MGGSELKKALQREVATRCKGFWSNQEEAVNSRRKEIEREIAGLEAQIQERQEAACQRLQREILARAQRQASNLRLQAESDLAEQLRQLAAKQLVQLYEENRAIYWERLAKEIPQALWQEVLVGERDVELAAKFFSKVPINVSPKLSGGLIALREGGRICIDNSLQRRLDRYWPILLPRLLEELRTMVNDDATP
ncbi:MAG: hypothetical protein C0614_12285 [Desulfuromonas sp.]|nr:MAG: hypothetical protein C0614_12285 [Desulfuromonas sp.]